MFLSQAKTCTTDAKNESFIKLALIGRLPPASSQCALWAHWVCWLVAITKLLPVAVRSSAATTQSKIARRALADKGARFAYLARNTGANAFAIYAKLCDNCDHMLFMVFYAIRCYSDDLGSSKPFPFSLNLRRRFLTDFDPTDSWLSLLVCRCLVLALFQLPDIAGEGGIGKSENASALSAL